MPELQLVRPDHASALLAFELENRAYFAASVPDRGDDYFATFAERHRELLAWRTAPLTSASGWPNGPPDEAWPRRRFGSYARSRSPGAD